MSDLYAGAAAGWVKEGRTRHYVYVQATDRELGGEGWPSVEGVVVRETDERDIEAMVEIGPELAWRQPLSPVFSEFRPDDPDESREEKRGSGAGLALTAASFAWARGRGYPAMVTDRRVTNLLSSRFWPKRGFRTTFLLYRSIP